MTTEATFLTGLSLRNFMSIAGPCTLDFLPITLLFGPNSAGKTAVYSAISLLSKLLRRERYRSFPLSTLIPYVHARDYSRTIVIGARFHTDYLMDPTYDLDERSPLPISRESFEELFFDLDYYISPGPSRPGFDFELTHQVSFTINNEEVRAYPHLSSICVNDHDLVRFDTESSVSFYLDNPLMRAIQGQLQKHNLSFASLLSSIFPDDQHVLEGDLLTSSMHLFITGETLNYSEDEVAPGKHGSQEKLIFDTLIRTIIALPLRHLRLACDAVSHIGPLRRILNDEQLTFLLKKYSYDSYAVIPSIEQASWSWHDGSLAWQRLAEHALKDNFVARGYTRNTSLTQEINQWLVSEQRLGLQHSIRATSGQIAPMHDPLNRGDALKSSAPIDPSLPDAIVKLQLEDVNLNIPVLVDNVGAGVPQLVPFLVAGITEEVVFIEQPELHLHPKVQTEIADFMLGCLNSYETRFVLETHSEYLALRLLRRIRETNTAHIRHRDFSITENKVAIYYFDHVRGVTDVKRLRISPDGDFIDRWPKGFFAEREAELFGEDD